MFGMIRRKTDARWYGLAIAGLVLTAWAVLAIWGASPFAGLLDHGDIGQWDLPLPTTLLVFVLGWTLMTVAMMLPSSLPLIHLFRRMVSGRAGRHRLVAILMLGYLAVWAGFGLLAYLGDSLLHEIVERSALLSRNEGLIAGGLLLVAGIYQFTPLKEMCLTECRSPYTFLTARWRGQRPSREAFRLGLAHGRFCLGCCWTLMLLMFAVGGVNLAWMLLLGVFMAVERSSRWGSYLTWPVGVGLIAWGVLVLAGGGEVDESTRQQMLAATVQIVLLAPVVDETGQPDITNNDGDLQMAYQVGEGLGTLVKMGAELMIVTHDHWSLLDAGLAKVRFYSADNVLLTEVSGAEFLGLIRSRDGGTLLLSAPAALLAGGLVPAALGDSDAAGWGDLVAVVYRQPVTGGLSVKNMAVTSTDDYQARPSYALQSAEGTVVVPGNSGGGVWQDGQLVGNMWTTWLFESNDDGSIRSSSLSRAAQLTAMSG